MWMMLLTTRVDKPTYATQQNDKNNVRPSENYTINGATTPTVPVWKKMQKDTTAKTGWINYVHQHEKMPSEKHDKTGWINYVHQHERCPARITTVSGEHAILTPRLVI